MSDRQQRPPMSRAAWAVVIGALIFFPAISYSPQIYRLLSRTVSSSPISANHYFGKWLGPVRFGSDFRPDHLEGKQAIILVEIKAGKSAFSQVYDGVLLTCVDSREEHYTFQDAIPHRSGEMSLPLRAGPGGTALHVSVAPSGGNLALYTDGSKTPANGLLTRGTEADYRLRCSAQNSQP